MTTVKVAVSVGLVGFFASTLACSDSTVTSIPPALDASDGSIDADAAPAPPFDDVLCGKLRALAKAYVTDGHTPGIAFSVTAKDGSVCGGAAGLADLGASAPMTPDSRFRIGSITKTFVAVVILELVEEKVLSLSDPISKWLPTFPQGTVTLERLLDHTSGLVDYLFDPSIQATQAKPHTSAELLAVAAQVQSGAVAPGTWHYSNTNYLLLGKIIEVATGVPWSVQVRKRILDRPELGLGSTFVHGFEPVPGGFVRGYQEGGSGWADETDLTHPTVMDAAGCMVSSMGDLGRFWRALHRGAILTPATLDVMRKHQVPVSPGQFWGLGIESQEGGTLGTLYGHGGGFAGYSNQMQYFDGPNVTLTVAVNASIVNDDPLELPDPITHVHKGIRPQLWQAILGL